MADRPVLKNMHAMKSMIQLVVFLVGLQVFSGCTIGHLYFPYRGRVLDKETNRPIEGAGVLAVYTRTDYFFIGTDSSAHGDYQAVLTDKEGRFTVPTKLFFGLRLLTWWNPNVLICIYKKGYGSFPGSFPGKYNPVWPKQGKTEPALENFQFNYGEMVTVWLPKLETEDEIREQGRGVSCWIPYGAVLPEGVTHDEFKKLYGTD